jgi:hypothetical protein
MATVTSIPIGSNLFSASHAVKKPAKSKPSNIEDAPPAAHAIPSPPPPAPFQQPPYTPFPPSPYGYPPYYRFPLPQPNFFAQLPAFGQAGLSSWGQPPPQPPSSPPPAGSSLDEFCDDYGISFTTRTRLDQLGFEMGMISHQSPKLNTKV